MAHHITTRCRRTGLTAPLTFCNEFERLYISNLSARPLSSVVSFLHMESNLSKTAIDYCLWGISGLVSLSALTKIRLLLGLFNFQQSWEQALVVVFFTSAVLGGVGLFRRQAWGFISVYVYILVATFFLSISVIPFILDLFSLGAKATTFLLLTINLTVLVFTIFLHVVKLAANRKMKSVS